MRFITRPWIPLRRTLTAILLIFSSRRERERERESERERDREKRSPQRTLSLSIFVEIYCGKGVEILDPFDYAIWQLNSLLGQHAYIREHAVIHVHVYIISKRFIYAETRCSTCYVGTLVYFWLNVIHQTIRIKDTTCELLIDTSHTCEIKVEFV